MLQLNDMKNLLEQQLNNYLIKLFTGDTINESLYNEYLKKLKDYVGWYYEKNYNATEPIRIIVKFFRAEANQQVIYQPMQLIVECAEEYSDNVAQCLLDWYLANDYDNNGLLISDENNYIIEEHLSSPVVIGNFQEDGIDKYTSFSIDVGLKIYEDAVGLLEPDDDNPSADTLKFGYTYNNTDYELALKNVLSINRSVIRTKDGKRLGQGNKKIIEADNSYQLRLTVGYIMNKNDELHTFIDREADSSNAPIFDITYNNSVNTFTYKMGIVSYSTQQLKTDVMKCDLTLCLEAGD